MNKNFSHFPVAVLLAYFILINKASGTDEARFFGRLPFLNANDNNYCDTACGKQQTRFAFFSILRNFCISRCPNSVVAHLGNSNSGSSTTNPNGSQSNINNIMHQVMQQMANNPTFGVTGGIPNFSIAPFPGNGNGQPQITFGNQPGNGIGQTVPNLQGPANGAPTQPGTSPAAGAPTAPAGAPGAAAPAGTPGAAAPAGTPGAAPPAGAPGAAAPTGAPGAAAPAAPAGAPGAAAPAGR